MAVPDAAGMFGDSRVGVRGLLSLLPWAAGAAGVGFAAYLFFVPYQRATRELERRSADLAAQRARVQELSRERDDLNADASQLNLTPDRRLRMAKFQSVQGALSDKLKAELAPFAAEVRSSGDRILVRFGEGAVFEGRTADISENGEKALEALGAAVKGATGVRVLVSAYLDASPPPKELRDLFPSNWELSAGRATNAVRYMVEEAHVPSALVMAGGAGEAQGARAIGGRRLEIEISPE